jgi:transcriptional regulator with XRE-family HTH domain
LYGSGFPKSLDVSKAIDKSNGKHDVDLAPFGLYVKERREAKGWSRSNLDDLMGTNTAVSWWEGRASGVQLPSKKIYARLKEVLELDNRFDYLIDWAEAEREVIGSKTAGMGSGKTFGMLQSEGNNAEAEKEIDITSPSTPEAQTWQGWGTALKPAFEPVIVARKPIEGTVANNVLKWGTGGLNIDGSRIGYQDEADKALAMPGSTPPTEIASGHITVLSGTRQPHDPKTGRWPANIILDPYTAELLDDQSGQTKSTTHSRGGGKGDTQTYGAYGNDIEQVRGVSDSGGASRFFYVAKASKRDRNEGLEELPKAQPIGGADKWTETDRRRGEGITREPSSNFHPTVKPTSLMRYLVKLVTPPNGTVLDPFTGSGSTGKAAILEGFDFIGIEMTEDYWPIIEGRLKHAEQMVAERIKETANQEQEKLF